MMICWLSKLPLSQRNVSLGHPPLLPGLADMTYDRLGGCDLVIIMAQTWPVQRQWATGATLGPQSEESFTNCAGRLFVCLLNWWEWSQFPTMMSLTLMTMIMTETEQWGGRGQMGTGTLYKLVNIIMASWHVSSLQYWTRLHRWSIVFQNGWSLQLQR